MKEIKWSSMDNQDLGEICSWHYWPGNTKRIPPQHQSVQVCWLGNISFAHRSLDRLSNLHNSFIHMIVKVVTTAYSSPSFKEWPSLPLLTYEKVPGICLLGFFLSFLDYRLPEGKRGIHYIHLCTFLHRTSLIAQSVKKLPAMQETWVQFLG